MWLPVRRPNDPAGAKGFLATGVGPVGQSNGNVGAPEGATYECQRLPPTQRLCRPFGAWGLWCDVSHGLTPVATFRRP